MHRSSCLMHHTGLPNFQSSTDGLVWCPGWWHSLTSCSRKWICSHCKSVVGWRRIRWQDKQGDVSFFHGPFSSFIGCAYVDMTLQCWGEQISQWIQFVCLISPHSSLWLVLCGPGSLGNMRRMPLHLASKFSGDESIGFKHQAMAKTVVLCCLVEMSWQGLYKTVLVSKFWVVSRP